MDIYKFSHEEKAECGFTHRIKLTHADLTETATNTAQTIALLDVGVGALVSRCAVRLVTAFKDASDAAFNTTTVIVGDDGDDDRFIASMETNENGTEILGKAHASTTPYVYLAANAIDIIFGSQSGKALNDIDVGELHVFLHVVDLDSHI